MTMLAVRNVTPKSNVSLLKVKKVENVAPRRVFYFNWEMDFQCVLLASCGLYNRAIARITGLSIAQVQYRISRWERARGSDSTLRTDYRAGTSTIAKLVLSNTESKMRIYLEKQGDKNGIYKPVGKGVLKG